MYIKGGHSPRLKSMLSESEMTSFLDMATNPFIDWSNHGVEQSPTTWNTDDVACAKVIAKIRREITKAEFKFNHPPLMYSVDQRRAYYERHGRFIAYWNSRLAEARYN